MGKLTETQVRGIIPDEYQELDFTSEQGSNGLPLKATCNGKRVFLKALKFTENNKSMIDDEVTALNDLNQLNNPNIAQLNRVLQPSEEYILLEFQLVEGKTLSTILKERKAENKPFTENETYKLAKDICSALSSVNSIDRVHHDVKPANIMFDGENYILLDFGISRLNDHKVNKRSRAIYMYSSPEQLLSWTGLTEGKRDQVTIQSDFFSLGVILYELLTLKYPFGDGSHDIVISEKHLPIKALRPDLSESLSNFVERLLEKRVGDRFLGVSDIADCIKNRSCDVKKKKVEGLIFYGHDHHATGGFLNFLNYRAGAPEHLPDGVRLSTSHFPKSDQVGQLLLSGYSFIVDPEVYFLPHKSKYTKNKLKYVPYNLKTDSYGEKLSNAEKLNQWVESVIDHQLRNNADILLAPSFLTSGTLDGNLLLNSKVIEVTKKIAKEKAPNRPLFVTYILKKDLLTSKDARTFIIGSAGTLEGFDGIYLLCESSVTGGRAPMTDKEHLLGLKEVVEKLSDKFPVLLAGAGTELFPLFAQGLSGCVANMYKCNFSTDNLTDVVESGGGGQRANQYFYVPALMNFIKVTEAQAIINQVQTVQKNKETALTKNQANELLSLFNCLCPFCSRREKFGDNNALSVSISFESWSISDSDNHYVYHVVTEARRLKELASDEAQSQVKAHLSNAKKMYELIAEKLNIKLDKKSSGEFLDVWNEVF